MRRGIEYSRFAKIAALATCLGAVLGLFIAPQSAHSSSNFETCYGETLDVSLPSVVEEDGDILERAVMKLPWPNSWYVIVTPGIFLSDLPCQEEPVEARIVRGAFMDPRLGNAHFDMAGIEGARFRLLNLTSTDPYEDAEIERVFEEKVLSEGAPTADGFHRQRSDAVDPVSGGWLFPETYLSPIGTRVRATCAIAGCTVEYRIKQNLKLNYRFVVIGKNQKPPYKPSHRRPPFIAVDEHVRATVMDWMDGPP